MYVYSWKSHFKYRISNDFVLLQSSNDNFDAFLKEFGVNKVLRTLAKTVKPRVIISEKDGKWGYRSESTLNTTAIEFTPGVEFKDKGHDGEEYTVK